MSNDMSAEAEAREMGFTEDVIALAKELAEVCETPGDEMMPGWFGWLDDARDLCEELADWDHDEWNVRILDGDHLVGASLVVRVCDLVVVFAQGRCVDGTVEMTTIPMATT